MTLTHPAAAPGKCCQKPWRLDGERPGRQVQAIPWLSSKSACNQDQPHSVTHPLPHIRCPVDREVQMRSCETHCSSHTRQQGTNNTATLTEGPRQTAHGTVVDSKETGSRSTQKPAETHVQGHSAAGTAIPQPSLTASRRFRPKLMKTRLH